METLTKNPTELQSLTVTELRKIASELNVKNYTKYKKPALLLIVQENIPQEEEIANFDQFLAKLKDQDAEITPAIESAFNSILKSDFRDKKSTMFRMLWDDGVTIARIAKASKSHYSFVHGVIQRYIKAQKK